MLNRIQRSLFKVIYVHLLKLYVFRYATENTESKYEECVENVLVSLRFAKVRATENQARKIVNRAWNIKFFRPYTFSEVFIHYC